MHVWTVNDVNENVMSEIWSDFVAHAGELQPIARIFYGYKWNDISYLSPGTRFIRLFYISNIRSLVVCLLKHSFPENNIVYSHRMTWNERRKNRKIRNSPNMNEKQHSSSARRFNNRGKPCLSDVSDVVSRTKKKKTMTSFFTVDSNLIDLYTFGAWRKSHIGPFLSTGRQFPAGEESAPPKIKYNIRAGKDKFLWTLFILYEIKIKFKI